MADDAETTALLARTFGKARTGIVTVRDFDRGVVETLGAKVIGEQYFITELPEVDAPPGMPGIPVVFAHPEEVFRTQRIPLIEVRRDDINPAIQRWHPGMTTYRVPSYGAKQMPSRLANDTRVGWERYEQAQQSAPFDILYTISIQARQRQFMAAANTILAYVLQIYQPYSAVFVTDSEGDTRSYEAFLDAIAPLDNVPEVAERMIGFALSLRVEAELDINPPKNYKAVNSVAVNGTLISTKTKE